MTNRTGRRKGAQSFVQNLAVLIVSIALSLVLLEILLQQFTYFPIGRYTNKIPHDELLYVLDKNYPDVDRFGFRNPDGPSGQRIVAIGDSYTYGNNVDWDEAWPKQLAAMVGEDVYNYGVGSYNIYHYFRLVELALESKPEHIIVALYPGNDLSLNVCETLDLEYWRARIAEMGLRNDHCERFNAERRRRLEARSWFETVRREVDKYESALLSAINILILRPLENYFEDEAALDVPEVDEQEYFTIAAGAVALRVGKRRVERTRDRTDRSRLEIAEHFENSKVLFAMMKAKAERSGAALSVLIIPSVERVIVRYVREHGIALPALLEDGVGSEDDLIASYLDLFAALSIPTMDATPALAVVMARDAEVGRQTFLRDDGHPFEAGYRAYAEAARRMLEEIESRASARR